MKSCNSPLACGFKYFFTCSPRSLEKWSSLTSILFSCWWLNHQPRWNHVIRTMNFWWRLSCFYCLALRAVGRKISLRGFHSLTRICTRESRVEGVVPVRSTRRRVEGALDWAEKKQIQLHTPDEDMVAAQTELSLRSEMMLNVISARFGTCLYHWVSRSTNYIRWPLRSVLLLELEYLSVIYGHMYISTLISFALKPIW